MLKKNSLEDSIKDSPIFEKLDIINTSAVNLESVLSLAKRTKKF